MPRGEKGLLSAAVSAVACLIATAKLLNTNVYRGNSPRIVAGYGFGGAAGGLLVGPAYS